MALHRSGSYLSLSFCSQFLSVHFCLSSYCHVPFPLLFLFSITTYISLLFFHSFSLPFFLFFFFFFFLLPNFLISGDVSISFSKHSPPFSFPPFPRSVLIFIPFPIVFRSSPLLSSLSNYMILANSNI
ncbi:hypothetical protein BO83DRAFT_219434 [Aspergillus eucalypticola CBS 122712]|uniref:Uncharacterized protein n=1 Tax=Aspergillus eucalypticola (strain CBS 122712 / IBT 29274) TaxID=1448314 RepID=A0A317VXR4_ASPEC|nr:uncharacterized protein BO83DRAFT_219434 [Aspergillus eucalypticola CBS 122712]PWY79073.1 hypothetical protein BO83DRAFT_219434 [Aspergillus eucalypticola CBS 122712]